MSMRIDDLDTPALVIDLDVLHRNIDEMSAAARHVERAPLAWQHVEDGDPSRIARRDLECDERFLRWRLESHPAWSLKRNHRASPLISSPPTPASWRLPLPALRGDTSAWWSQCFAM